MNPYVLSGLQSVVLFVDGLKTGTTTKLSFATGNTTSQFVICPFIVNIQPIKISLEQVAGMCLQILQPIDIVINMDLIFVGILKCHTATYLQTYICTFPYSSQSFWLIIVAALSSTHISWILPMKPFPNNTRHLFLPMLAWAMKHCVWWIALQLIHKCTYFIDVK